MDILKMAFILALVLIGVAYFVGLSTDTATFASGANTLINTLTGRNSQGNFVNYPH